MDLLDHYLRIVLLGIVEGVTEFLPISSTGHLLIAEHWLGTNEPDVFNVVIQAGAILAVVFIYWHKIADLFGSFERPESQSYLFKLFVAFFVTCAVGYVAMDKYHLKLPESLVPVAWATLIGGLVIFAVEFVAKNLYPHDDVSWPEAILIGLAQIVAGIFPGTSRSGATIMTGMAMGMRRTTATEFSFLVGIPTMFTASAHELVKYRKDLTSADHQLLLDIAVGFFVSLVVAFFVVKWLLRFIQSHTFNGFAIYRVLLGGGLLIAIALHPALAEIGKDAPKATPPVQAAPAPVVTPAPTPEAAPANTNADGTPAVPTTSADQTASPDAATNSVPVNPGEATNADAPTTHEAPMADVGQ